MGFQMEGHMEHRVLDAHGDPEADARLARFNGGFRPEPRMEG